ncbi:MAG: hypothetical protein AMXMBFR84_13110 [Candidatus Hydrogenedentota bacterium]
MPISSPVSSASKSLVPFVFMALALLWPAVVYHVLPLKGQVHATDSVSYTQMAKGILHWPDEPIGLRFLDWDGKSPTFNSTFPVGYPLLIALVSLSGIPIAISALLVPFLCYCLNGLLFYLIASRLTNARTGLAVSILASFAFPFLDVAWTAWSETPAITSTLFAFLVLAIIEAEAVPKDAVWPYTLAGLAAGFTFCIRYAMLPFPCAFVLAIAWGRWKHVITTRQAVAGIAGCCGLVSGLLVMNSTLSGNAMGPYRHPAEESFAKNAATVVNHLTYTVTGVWGELSRPVLAGLVLISFTAIALACAYWALDTLVRGKAGTFYWTSLLFAGGYPAFIVVSRSLKQYDPIDIRFMVPFLAVYVLLFLTPSVHAILEGETNRLKRAASVCIAGSFLLGFPLTWIHEPDQHHSTRWHLNLGTDRPDFAALSASVSEDRAALITVSHEMAYIWDRGPSVIIDPQSLQADDERVAEFTRRVGMPVYFYVPYDHPEFTPAEFGPFVEELFAGTAGGNAEMLHDSGKAKLWRLRAGI